MQFNPAISIFENARTPQPFGASILLKVILDNVQKETYRKEIETLRGLLDQDKRDNYKKTKLRAVTFSGIFTHRDKKSLTEYSHIICQDIDDLHPDLLPHVKTAVCKEPNVLACFISPSGNGLKILFRVATGADQHLEAFESIANYLDNKGFMLSHDEKCKDTSRLCFLSYDPDIYINWDAAIVDEGFIKAHAPKKAKTKKTDLSQRKTTTPAASIPVPTAAIDKCHEILRQAGKAAQDGSYNDYINCFALQANRYGISENDCISELRRYCGADSWSDANREVDAVVQHVYDNFSAEHDQYNKTGHEPKVVRQEQAPKNYTAAKQKSNSTVKNENTGKVYDTSVLFWYKTEKVDKKTGEILPNTVDYKFSYDDAITFLHNNGFFKYKHQNNGFQLIYVDEQTKVVDIVNELFIKEFFISFLKTNNSPEYKQVREMFRRGAKNYCSTSQLEGLDYFKPVLKKDTSTTAYVYFKNCYLEITAQGITRRELNELDGHIWRKQIIDFEYHEADYKTGDFTRFMKYAIIGRSDAKEGAKPYEDAELLKFHSVCSTTGYLLHRYKDPTITKAVIAVDKKLRRTGEANGRSGKSLYAKALAKVRNTTLIDGPNFKWDYEFAFQAANIDTEIINFNDVPKNFDFYRMFGMITEELTINKKKIDSITIPFDDSPKFYVSTNYTMKGDGESNKGRQQVIEFSTYFNTDNTPIIEFGGRMFFYNWDAAEWCKFYSFCNYCIQLYLKKGLIDFPLENYAFNKLIDACGDDFVEFMDDNVKAKMIAENKKVDEFEAHVLFEEYKKATRKDLMKITTFTKHVKMWCDVSGMLFNASANGDRIKRNNYTYYEFTDTLFGAGPGAATDDKLPF